MFLDFFFVLPEFLLYRLLDSFLGALVLDFCEDGLLGVDSVARDERMNRGFGWMWTLFGMELLECRLAWLYRNETRTYQGHCGQRRPVCFS
jgi:hypothetical protein